MPKFTTCSCPSFMKDISPDTVQMAVTPQEKSIVYSKTSNLCTGWVQKFAPLYKLLGLCHFSQQNHSPV